MSSGVVYARQTSASGAAMVVSTLILWVDMLRSLEVGLASCRGRTGACGFDIMHRYVDVKADVQVQSWAEALDRRHGTREPGGAARGNRNEPRPAQRNYRSSQAGASRELEGSLVLRPWRPLRPSPRLYRRLQR